MTFDQGEGAQRFLGQFADPAAIARYAEGPPRFLPGFEAMHKMTSILLDENMPADGRLLVLGAGGGLEIAALSRDHAEWQFTGVDPARPMLDLAADTLGPVMNRVDLIDGYIDDAPQGPFDGAICLLTLHFLDRAERVRTLAAIRNRLKPGAPFVAVHSSFPQEDEHRPRWLDRYAAYALASGADPEIVANARANIEQTLSLFTPSQDEAMLHEAGFRDAEMFFAAFTWRGWVGHA
jgi:tRNA (cmo5U34)-methyltransferase